MTSGKLSSFVVRRCGLYTRVVVVALHSKLAHTHTQLISNFLPPLAPPFRSYDIGPQYVVSLGDFMDHGPDGGGELCVECGVHDVGVIDARGRIAKVDGRFPHWVRPYTGERYSIVWFMTQGETIPRTSAVFGEPWCGREEEEEDCVTQP